MNRKSGISPLSEFADLIFKFRETEKIHLGKKNLFIWKQSQTYRKVIGTVS